MGITYYGMSTGTSRGKDSSAGSINGLVGINYQIYGAVRVNFQYDFSRIISKDTFVTSINKEYSVLKAGVEHVF